MIVNKNDKQQCLANRRLLKKNEKINELFNGFIIFAGGGLYIFVDTASPINIFGVPKGENIPVGSIMALPGLFFI